jgi:hypothetical protein
MANLRKEFGKADAEIVVCDLSPCLAASLMVIDIVGRIRKNYVRPFPAQYNLNACRV